MPLVTGQVSLTLEARSPFLFRFERANLEVKAVILNHPTEVEWIAAAQMPMISRALFGGGVSLT